MKAFKTALLRRRENTIMFVSFVLLCIISFLISAEREVPHGAKLTLDFQLCKERESDQ